MSSSEKQKIDNLRKTIRYHEALEGNVIYMSVEQKIHKDTGVFENSKIKFFN